MPPRIIAQLLGTLLISATLGAGGWYLWKLRRQEQATARQLQETQASLTRTQETLTRTEEERSELLLAYDELKGRLAKADEELSHLNDASTQMTTELATLTSDRTKLTTQLGEVTQQTGRLHEQITTLETEYAAIEAEKVSLEQRLQETSSASLSPEEVKQLTQAVARSQGEAARLSEQMAVLSRAYEQVAQAPSPAAAKPAANDARSAQRYRHLGDVYLATYQYPKAAEAYEQALTFGEDPTLHTKLVFLYSRLLHNPQKAQQHAAVAPTRDPTSATLGSTASAQGLPRKGWRLIWNWLTQ